MRNKLVGRNGKVLCAAALCVALFTACGTAAGTMNDTGANVKTAAPMKAAVEEAAAADETFEAGAYDSGAGMAYDMSYAQEGDDVEPETVTAPEAGTERKLIKTVNISAETEQFDILMPSLQEQVKQLGGYIEEISIYNNENYYAESRMETLRGAGMTARVPKENLDSFLAQVGEQSNVVSQSERVEDVTLQYVDLDSHKRVLVAEQERLIELLEQAETVEDLIAIEGRLSEVRYQIESMESQLRTYDNKIDYSTVYLSIREVKKYTPPQDITVWEKIGNGFVNSLENIGKGIGDFFIGLLINIPYIVLWAVIIVMSVLIIRQILSVAVRRLRKSGHVKGDRRGGMRFWAGKKAEIFSRQEETEPMSEDEQEEKTPQEEQKE